PARNEGQTGLPRKARGDFPRPTQDVDIAFGCPAGNAGDQATGRGKAECPARAEADFGLAESPGFFDSPTDSRNATEASSCRIECKTGSAGSPAGPPRRAHGAAEGHGNAPADGPPAAPLRVLETRRGGPKEHPASDERDARFVPRDLWRTRPRSRHEPPPRRRPQSAPRQPGHRSGPPRDRRVPIGHVPSFADGTPESSGNGAPGGRSSDRLGWCNPAG